MISPTSTARAQLGLRFALGAVVVTLLGTPSALDAQGLVQGVQQGAKAGNKAAGPVGGVLGGAIGGGVGVVTRPPVVGDTKRPRPPAAGSQTRRPPRAAHARPGA